MTDFLNVKDVFYLAFMVIALYFSNRDSYKRGVLDGIEGCIAGMIKDGYIDYDPETDEISAKKS